MNKPKHEDVAQRAREIWQSYGSPEGRDEEIWLEAERQLSDESANELAATPPSGDEAGNEVQTSSANSEDRNTGAPAAPSAPVMPAAEEVQASLQKKTARAPKTPSKKAPKTAPAPTGKPLWSKPHSS
jgi:hypothetical protein